MIPVLSVPLVARKPPAGGIGTPVKIADTGGTGVASGSGVTTTVTAPAGSLIVVGVLQWSVTGATITGVSDSAGNTYTQAEQNTGGGSDYPCSLWYCSNAPNTLTSGGTITATTSSGTYVLSAIYVASANNGLDPAHTHTVSGGPTNVTISTGTLAQANEIVFGVSQPDNAGGGHTGASGFTSITEFNEGSFQYKIVNSTASVTYSIDYNGTSSHISAVIAAFKG